MSAPESKRERWQDLALSRSRRRVLNVFGSLEVGCLAVSIVLLGIGTHAVYSSGLENVALAFQGHGHGGHGASPPMFLGKHALLADGLGLLLVPLLLAVASFFLFRRRRFLADVGGAVLALVGPFVFALAWTLLELEHVFYVQTHKDAEPHFPTARVVS